MNGSITNVSGWVAGFVLAAGMTVEVHAADVALLINNAANAQDLTGLTQKLNTGGFEVRQRTDATRSDMALALSEVADELDGAERLILVYFGETRVALGRTWLMPADFDGESAVDVAFGAVDAGILTTLAAGKPGRSAVFLGLAEGEVSASGAGRDEFRAGATFSDAPQGVVVAAGPSQLVSEALERMLSEGVSVADALADPADDLAIFGFVSPDFSFVSDTAVPVLQEVETPPAKPVIETSGEAAEAALALDQAARRKVQERLTVLGFNTRGIDGLFGPGTRAAISEWQDTRDLSSTGYLSSEQLGLLGAEADARSAELAIAAERARQEEEAADAAFWQNTGANGKAADLRVYLDRYPDGIYAGQAQQSLDDLAAEARSNAKAEDRAAWDKARSADRVNAYNRYLESYPQGAFVGDAEARIAELKPNSAKAEAAERAAALEDAMGLNSGSRALIQGQLDALGYEPGNTDGTFDRSTRKALRQFQTRQGLTVTGYVDQETVRSLIVASLVPR